MSEALVAEAPRRTLPKPLYVKLRPRPNGPGPDVVADHQRARLYGAMIESVARQGYAATTMAGLCKLAGVSTRTTYQLFAGKEAYFLGTYDAIVARAVKRIRAAYEPEGDWQARLRCALGAFAAEVVDEPEAARLALVEALGASAGSVARMQRTRRIFEQMIGASFSEARDGVTLPPPLVKGIVCGIERITRQQLLAGTVEELPALTEELLAWTLSYRFPDVPTLLAASSRQKRPAPGRPRAQARSQRVRILHAAAQIAARGGYAQLTAGQIVHAAGVSEEAFRALYESSEQCFLDVLDRIGLEALVCAKRASQSSEDRLVGVHRAIVALMDLMAEDPVLARIACVELFAVGVDGVQRVERLLGTITGLFLDGLPESTRPSEPAAAASVGAVWGLVHHHVTQDATQLLPGLADYAAYMALAPVIGAEAAVQVILAGGSKPRLEDRCLRP
ncbi:MAG TPA: TetR/AcrR family transcriptional regulator [Solirubrobacteraceae bacterium]